MDKALAAHLLSTRVKVPGTPINSRGGLVIFLSSQHSAGGDGGIFRASWLVRLAVSLSSRLSKRSCLRKYISVVMGEDI